MIKFNIFERKQNCNFHKNNAGQKLKGDVINISREKIQSKVEVNIYKQYQIH